jgi:hypothetical protein
MICASAQSRVKGSDHLQTLEKSVTATSLEPESQHTWLQVLSHVSPEYGGIAVSVPSFARATEVQSSIKCPIVGFCDAAEIEHMPESQRMAVDVFPKSRMRWALDVGMRNRLRGAIREASGVHIHGLWESHSVVSALLARSSKRAYMISAHGMLEPWALRHKRVNCMRP